MRKYLAFVLLGVLTVVGLGAAVLGIAQSSSAIPLSKAVTNTLAAASYTEVLAQHTPQGNETANLVYQSPDRLGGWLVSGKQRTYVVIIGTTEYISVSQPAKNTRIPKVFYIQQSGGVQAVDPVHTYLGYHDRGPSTTSGDVTTVTITGNGQPQLLKYTVTGNYVTNFQVSITGSSINLDISDFGTSPPVSLPKGARIVKSPGETAPTG